MGLYEGHVNGETFLDFVNDFTGKFDLVHFSFEYSCMVSQWEFFEEAMVEQKEIQKNILSALSLSTSEENLTFNLLICCSSLCQY